MILNIHVCGTCVLDEWQCVSGNLEWNYENTALISNWKYEREKNEQIDAKGLKLETLLQKLELKFCSALKCHCRQSSVIRRIERVCTDFVMTVRVTTGWEDVHDIAEVMSF